MTVMNWKATAKVLYPTGTYKVRINKWERGESFSKKSPQIMWTAEVIEPEEYRGGQVADYCPLTEAALWKTSKLIQACGIDISKLDNMDVNSRLFETILNLAVGRTTFWNIVDKTLEDGKTFNNVVDYKIDKNQQIIEPKIEKESWE